MLGKRETCSRACACETKPVLSPRVLEVAWNAAMGSRVHIRQTRGEEMVGGRTGGMDGVNVLRPLGKQCNSTARDERIIVLKGILCSTLGIVRLWDGAMVLQRGRLLLGSGTHVIRPSGLVGWAGGQTRGTEGHLDLSSPAPPQLILLLHGPSYQTPLESVSHLPLLLHQQPRK